MSANWQFQTNKTPATGAVAVYYLITAMLAAGWKKLADSDGTTYSSSGTQVTSGASGANGLGNTDAWVRMQDPASLREFTFQRGSDNQHWRVKYSMAAHFTGGSPSATQTPSATDHETVIGGGTDASPSFAAWFSGSDGAYRFSCAADANPYAVTIGATTYNVYRFFSFGFPTGGGNPDHGFAIDPLDPVLNAPTFGYDQDPIVIYNGVGSGTQWMASLTNQNNFMGWVWPTGSSSPVWSTNMYTDCNQNFVTGNNFTQDPSTNKDYGGKCLYYAPSTAAVPKGYGTFMLQHLTGSSGTPRSTAQGLTKVTAGDYILIGWCELPWDGSTPTI